MQPVGVAVGIVCATVLVGVAPHRADMADTVDRAAVGCVLTVLMLSSASCAVLVWSSLLVCAGVTVGMIGVLGRSGCWCG